MNDSNNTKMVDILAILATILTFLLPLKFGISNSTPEIAISLPNTAMRLLIFSWPPPLFSFFSSLLLIGVLILIPQENSNSQPQNRLIAFSWFALFLSVIPGIINASVVDFYLIQLIHFAGIATFAIAIYKLIDRVPKIKLWLINAIIASTVLVALMGLSQYISGFDATLKYANNKELKSGFKIASNMKHRLSETRIFSTFSICNSLAAHLILTIPFIIWGMIKHTSTVKTVITTLSCYALLMVIFSNIDQVTLFLALTILLIVIAVTLTKLSDENLKLIMPLILIPVTGILLFVLRFTNSRGGLIAFALSIILLVFISPLKRKKKIILAIILPLTIIPAIFSDIFARSLSSMTVRFDYYISALKIFAKQPILGTGWGDFFHDYTTIKTFPGSEAPHTPHNFILAFASQAGIIGLLASLNVIVLPFYYFFKPTSGFKCPSNGHTSSRSSKLEAKSLNKVSKNKSKKDYTNWENIVIITGWFAWTSHSLLDFNIQISATVATAIVMLLLMNFTTKNREQTNKKEPIEKQTNEFPGPEGQSIKPTCGNKKTTIIYYTATITLALFTLITSANRLYTSLEHSKLYNLCNFVPTDKAQHPPSFESIKKQLEVTTKLMPYSPFPWMHAGKIAKRYQAFKESELYLKEAIKRSPERGSLYKNLSDTQQYLGKLDESNKNLKKAAKLFPNAYGE